MEADYHGVSDTRSRSLGPFWTQFTASQKFHTFHLQLRRCPLLWPMIDKYGTSSILVRIWSSDTKTFAKLWDPDQARGWFGVLRLGYGLEGC